MLRKGFRCLSIGMLFVASSVMPVTAEDSVEDISEMMAWWEAVGSDWIKTDELILFSLDNTTPTTYVLAENERVRNAE